MSLPQDMADSQVRNEFGFNAGNGNAIHAPVDNSVNKPLPWIVLACILGSMSLMGVILMPGLIDAKVKANAATCELALKTAYTAKDQVDVAIAKAKARESK